LARAAAFASLAGLCLPALAQVNPIQPTPPLPTIPDSPPPKPPPPAPAAQPAQDGPSYPVSAFVIRYATQAPDRPPIEDLLALNVDLAQSGGVFVAPRPGLETVTLKIEDLAGGQRAPRLFSASAINAIGARIVQELNRRNIIGVLVAPDPQQINPQTLEDLRPEAVRTMTLDVWTRSVSQIRTLGAGERWSKLQARGDAPSAQNRIDNIRHQRIRENSPLQPGPAGQPGDLLRKDEVDDYLYRLNRQPGRHVDVAISSAENPGDVVLDYIVTESRPWSVYFQVSNTGTEETNVWRERFGFVHNQLLNRDDILSLDYITAGGDSNDLTGSYEAPVGGSQKLRWKIFGNYDNFTASDVGFANERFKGDGYNVGAELVYNIFQRRQSFIDLVGGARYEHQHVINEAVDVTGATDFFLPYVGLRFDRDTGKSNTHAEVRLETNLSGVAGTSEDEAQKLGRLVVDKDWTAIRWDVSTAFYLEPILFGAAWSDAASPYRKTTLAHEVALSFKGQNTFGARVIPQEEGTVGGLYTVRGYPESLVAGDDVYIFSAEYRFHLPRILAVQSDPSQTPLFGKPFRFSPDQRYSRPDWDLIFRGFLDVGRAVNNNRQSFEQDSTLVGTGVGVEFLFKRNIDLRLDYGVALHDAADVHSGDSRLHFVGTILY
jgi:hemolysin activation/secretion protein